MSNVLRTYYEDIEIAKLLIKHDENTTRQYFYRQCYPLFKSIYDNYYTDCSSCLEFINEIYLLVLTPSKKTGKCQMQNFKGESTLTSWLKSVCLFYCYRKYEKKNRIPVSEPIVHNNEDSDDFTNRLEEIGDSIKIDFEHIERNDFMTILKLMPNDRYRTLLRLRYWKQFTNEETAKIMDMTMDVFYNIHMRAKKQFSDILRKEESHE